MNGFYIVMIGVGSFLVFASLIFIFFDRKKSQDFIKKLDLKKQELTETVSDAEQLLEEMNKFSEYFLNQSESVLNQIETKIQEMNNSLKKADEAIGDENSMVEQDEACVLSVKSGGNSSSGLTDQLYDEADESVLEDNPHRDGNVIMIANKHAVSNKYAEVLRLSKEGLNQVDIAKKLNMGMGEVELIIGLRK